MAKIIISKFKWNKMNTYKQGGFLGFLQIKLQGLQLSEKPSKGPVILLLSSTTFWLPLSLVANKRGTPTVWHCNVQLWFPQFNKLPQFLAHENTGGCEQTTDTSYLFKLSNQIK